MADDKKTLKPPFELDKLFDIPRPPKAAAAADDTPAAHDHDHGQLDPIAERCRRLAEQVQFETLKPMHNLMRPCRGELEIPPCREVQLPDLRPRFYVFWGDSVCDCIESDDTETMFLVVYNPYRNLTLCNVEVNRLRVTDMNGNDVPLLPDQTPSIELVPRGPYCFGDLPPCRIGWRQFVLRLRGAVAGPYRILTEGVCFELCLHRMTEDCVTFNVCEDN